MSESETITNVIGELETLLNPAERPDATKIVAFSRNYPPEVWGKTLDVFQKLAQALLQVDETLMAYDLVEAGLKAHPANVLLRQLKARTLIRTGATETAHATLLELQQDGDQDEETLGLLGRTYKDLAEAASDPVEHTRLVHQAFDAYYEAYNLPNHGYWPGINAATMALVLGRADLARRLAQDVRARCPVLLDRPGEDRYWLLSTLGEAALILGERPKAIEAYSRAAEAAKHRHYDLRATRRNARLLLAYLGEDPAFLDECFKIPVVVAFVGHMIDRPGRTPARFPRWLELSVRQELHDRLEKLNAGFGYCSLACGADILFAEEMLARDGRIHVVLPHCKSHFIPESVDFIPGSNWKTRCLRLLAAATHVTEASEHSSTREGKQYEYSNQVLQGLAMKRARQFDGTAVGLAVWDMKTGDGSGGTEWTVKRWRDSGLQVEIVDLAKVLRDHSPELASPEPAPRPARPPAPTLFHPDIHGLLFADAAGFSKLAEDEVLLFVDHFLKLVGEIADRHKSGLLMRNTWGDGLYFVLQNVREAGLLALELCEAIAATSWSEKKLPNLNLRVGLHAGPVYRCDDPVTGRPNYVGSHVSPAARIEPIAVVGTVYASEQFAALAAVEGVEEFTCDYVGQTPMAKGYGVFPTYVVRRRNATPLTTCVIGAP